MIFMSIKFFCEKMKFHEYTRKKETKFKKINTFFSVEITNFPYLPNHILFDLSWFYKRIFKNNPSLIIREKRKMLS